jgi:hypothetical protein
MFRTVRLLSFQALDDSCKKMLDKRNLTHLALNVTPQTEQRGAEVTTYKVKGKGKVVPVLN